MYEQVRAKLFNKKIVVEKDVFKEQGFCPLGMSDRIENYMRNKEEFEKSPDLVGFKINPKDFFAGAMICPSGYGKGRHTKNIVKAFWKKGYKILIIDAKSHEFLSANRVGNGKRIHPYDKNEKLPVVGYVPSYCESEIQEHMKSKFKIYSHKITEFRSRELWSSLGMSDKSADFCVSCIEDGVDDIKVMENRLIQDDTLLGITKKAGLSAINLLIGTKFFNPNRKEIDIKKHWDKDEIISISYFSKSGALMNTDIGTIINRVKQIGAEELKKGTQYVTPKLVILDDCFYYLSSKETKSDEINLAIKETLNIANNYRSFGMHMLLEVQATNLVDFRIIESCNRFFIGKIRRPSSMLDIVPKDVYKVLNSSGDINEPPPLLDDGKRYVREWIYLDGSDWVRYFPFDVTVGHE